MEDSPQMCPDATVCMSAKGVFFFFPSSQLACSGARSSRDSASCLGYLTDPLVVTGHTRGECSDVCVHETDEVLQCQVRSCTGGRAEFTRTYIGLHA